MWNISGSMKALSIVSTFLLLFSTQAELPDKYNEALVPAYELPEVLIKENGERVEDALAWSDRRAELLQLFAEHMHGHVPAGVSNEIFPKVRKQVDFLDGRATLREVRVHFVEPDGPFMDLLVILPAGEGPHPLFLGFNFGGNHTIHPSRDISLTESWVKKIRWMPEGAVVDHRATDLGRGCCHRWPVEDMIDSGIGLATAYYGDVDPDFDDGFKNGVHAIFGQPKKNEWGSIATWAWALSRAMDYIETVPECDSEKVAVFGHSRLGKTALWAGANDTRFAMVISNNSGSGGAALTRRRFGERLQDGNTMFPYWFSKRFHDYNEKEDTLPIDQHQLLALIAPRCLHIASASEDLWADPKGEYLSAYHAAPVYELLGKQGLGKEVRYHKRHGKHDVMPFDWQQFINTFQSEVIFAD